MGIVHCTLHIAHCSVDGLRGPRAPPLLEDHRVGLWNMEGLVIHLRLLHVPFHRQSGGNGMIREQRRDVARRETFILIVPKPTDAGSPKFLRKRSKLSGKGPVLWRCTGIFLSPRFCLSGSLRTPAQILPSFAAARSIKDMESRKWGQKDKHQLTAKGALTGLIAWLKSQAASRVAYQVHRAKSASRELALPP